MDKNNIRPIEHHPSFTLTNEALELLDPEIRERLTEELSKGERKLKPDGIDYLQQRAEKPVRDFIWETGSGKKRISEMDPEFLLVVARHCIHRSNLYHQRLRFFVDVLEIVEEHAATKGLTIPDTVDEVQDLIDQKQPVEARLFHDQPLPPGVTDPPSDQVLSILRNQKTQKS